MTVKLLGVPYDAHSSFLRGPALAPAAIRAALTCGSANWCTESGLDLDPATNRQWVDLGDLTLPEDAAVAVGVIRAAAGAAIEDGSPLLSLGGDHLVTWPLVQAVTDHVDDVTIVHFDAHPDLYDSLDGDRFSHACPFARIMEEGRVRRLVQLGIRTMTPHQREQAERFGVEVHELRDWDGTLPAVSGPVYVTVDLDALDPAFAPGVSHHEPGGLTTRQVLDVLRQLGDSDAVIVGADVVELNPTRDVHDVTAMLAAKLTRELLGLLLD
jgi:agmatinase